MRFSVLYGRPGTKYRPAPSSIKMSAETLKLITNGLKTVGTIDHAHATLYGIPLVIDDSLPLNAVQYVP
jgi:hypothetical protein